MDFDVHLTPATVELGRREYVARCHAKNCRKRATTIARKMDKVGRFIRQIELCDRHAEVVATRERGRGLRVVDERQRVYLPCGRKSRRLFSVGGQEPRSFQNRGIP